MRSFIVLGTIVVIASIFALVGYGAKNSQIGPFAEGQYWLNVEYYDSLKHSRSALDAMASLRKKSDTDAVHVVFKFDKNNGSNSDGRNKHILWFIGSNKNKTIGVSYGRCTSYPNPTMGRA
jgi:hypothetical protein